MVDYSNNRIPTISEFISKENAIDTIRHGSDGDETQTDVLLYDAGLYVIEEGCASVSMLQRKYRIGFNRATALIDCLEYMGVIDEPRAANVREVLVSREDFKQQYAEQVDPDTNPAGYQGILFDREVDIVLLFEEKYVICDKADKLLLKAGEGIREMPLRDQLRQDLRDFVLYLAASDDVISVKEMRFLEMFLGYRYTPTEAKDFIIDNNIYSEEFERKLPISLELLAKADNYKYHRRHADPKMAPEGFQLFLIVGRMFRDGKKHRSIMESNNFTHYLTNLAANTSKVLENGSIEVR